MAGWMHARIAFLKTSVLHGLSRRRVAALCVLSIALLALNSLIFYQNMRTIVEHDRAVRHSQVVLAALDDMLSALVDAETGERGYIITGDRSYLQPYTAALQHIAPDLTQLATLTADNADQRKQMPALRALIAAKLAEMQLAIDAVQQAPDPAARVTLSGEDRSLMDQLRATIGAMRRAELVLLDTRSTQAQRATDAAIVALVLATVVGMALIVGIFALIWRDNKRRARALEEREQLLRREQAARVAAEEAVQARETFLSLASHELRTPLTSMLGNAQLLQRTLAQYEGLTERDRGKVASILRQGERLRALTEQLLDTSRLQQGQLSIERAPLDLVSLVRATVAEAQSMTATHTLELRAPDAPLPIEGDAMRLEQVLFNLLNNAIKYSPRAARIIVTVAREGDSARLAVTDFGIGIPAAAQSHLFDRFFRASNVDAGGGTISGLGIGLYVVKEVVSRHGGHIEVHSAEGEGSTFIVRLPLSATAGVLASTRA
jgi:signal transduction histidine kinase